MPEYFVFLHKYFVFFMHKYFAFVKQSNMDGGYGEGLNRIACTSALQSIAG